MTNADKIIDIIQKLTQRVEDGDRKHGSVHQDDALSFELAEAKALLSELSARQDKSPQPEEEECHLLQENKKLRGFLKEAMGWNWLTAIEESSDAGIEHFAIKEMQEIADYADKEPSDLDSWLNAPCCTSRASALLNKEIQDKLLAENKGLRDHLKMFDKAKASLFEQCLSNPIYNSWNKQINLSVLNEAFDYKFIREFE